MDKVNKFADFKFNKYYFIERILNAQRYLPKEGY